jgi:hypothetical protein
MSDPGEERTLDRHCPDIQKSNFRNQVATTLLLSPRIVFIEVFAAFYSRRGYV